MLIISTARRIVASIDQASERSHGPAAGRRSATPSGVYTSRTVSIRGAGSAVMGSGPHHQRVGEAVVQALLLRVTSLIQTFSARRGFDLTTIALHGWSEAQRNELLRGLMRDFYAAFRDRLADRVRRWQAEGEVDAAAEPADVAQTLLSLLLGFVVQSAIVHDADPQAHQRGLQAMRACHA